MYRLMAYTSGKGLFMRLFVFCLMGLIGLFAATDAQACRYKSQPLKDSLAAAATAFVGTVEVVENGLATFRVQHALKGVAQGATFDVDTVGGGSCALQFLPGQRWLYLGKSGPAGSRVLEDQYARLLQGNITMAEEATGISNLSESHALRGTAEGWCAPWDGKAFRISLNNGWAAIVYDSLPLDHMGADHTLRSYTLKAELKAQSGQVMQCDENGEGCKAYPAGEVHISAVTDKEVSGQMVIRFGEHESRYPFRVERTANKVMSCG